MKKQNKNLYEGMYIFNPSLSEDAIKKALHRISSSIEGFGGEIHKVHDQGRKKLAYQIGGHKQGQYFLLYFSVIPSAILDLWKEYQLNEDLIRFMTMRTDKVQETIEFKPLIED
tara:strand:- start:43 stop:384 length:342 start_codon:yes stop_codon:yes gene_type:complete